MDYQAFISATNEMAAEVHQNAVKHGFYVAAPSLPERLMLMVSELSEALEEFRNGTPTQYVARETSIFTRNIEDPNEWKPNEKPEGVGVELADCIIRILDTCAYEGIDIGALIAKKHEYNLNRPYKHGGKLI
jgi:hypothetical protein